MRRVSLTVLVFYTSISCSSNEQHCSPSPDISKIEVHLEIDRLELELFQQRSPENVLSFLHKYPTFTNQFIDSYEYPSDTILANRTFQMITNKYITDTLYKETMQTFGNFDELKDQFTETFKRIKYYYPAFNVPKIQTSVTGFYKDLLLSDSLIIIGLDHYLGKSATYHPQDIPQYILDRYEPENVVPMVVYFLSDNFNHVDFSKETLLHEMVDFGKAYFFTKQMVPCASDAQIVGYSPEVLSDVVASQETIWASFIQNELIYETDHEIKVKFIGERPKIPEIGSKCPGRIAAWLGYEIVKSYMKNNSDVTLPELMSNADATEIFMQSGYKPRNQ